MGEAVVFGWCIPYVFYVSSTTEIQTVTHHLTVMCITAHDLYKIQCVYSELLSLNDQPIFEIQPSLIGK
jgi:hypothetical protein